jgi:hypothetical protein
LTAFAIEDACRTELTDGERLVLVRRLDLGRNGRDRRAQAAALKRGYAAAAAAARHGGADGAEASNCVWFASHAEARLLLLAAVLAGKRPSAWFWRLIVPAWQGQAAEPWLTREVQAALAGDDGAPDIVGLVTLAVDAGAVDILIRVLAGTAVAPSLPWRDEPAFQPVAAARVRRWGAEPGAPLAAAEREAVVRLRERLPPSLVETVETLVRRIRVPHRASALLIRRLLLITSPSLALSPPLLRSLVDRWCGEIVSPAAPQAAASRPAPETAASLPAPPSTPAGASRTPDVAAVPPSPRPAAKTSRAPQKPLPAAPHRPGPPLPAVGNGEQSSAAAGLWLAIPSLIRLGLREWLEERPSLLAADPGRILVRTIAARHRLAPNDPAMAPLALPADAFEPPPWALHWCAGLDRWLRRRARLPLDRLVWRAGWLRQTGDRLIIRFPPHAADIRLRRHALDIDPGWTDWLGLSVRYLYADRTIW